VNAGQSITVLCIYRHPGCDFSASISELGDVINSLPGRNIICAGDLNVDISREARSLIPRGNSSSAENRANQYLDLCASVGMQHLVFDYTRCSIRGTKTTLDHTMINFAPTSFESYVIEAPISDHFPTVTVLALGQKLEGRCLSVVHENSAFLDTHKLSKILQSYSWDELMGLDLPEDILENFIFSYDLCVAASTKESRHKHETVIPNFWESAHIKSLVRLRSNLYKWSRRAPGNVRLHKYYRYIQRRCRIAIRNTKARLFQSSFLREGMTTRKQWAMLNDVISPSTKLSMFQLPDDVTADDMVDGLAEQFASVMQGADSDHGELSSTSDLEQVVEANCSELDIDIPLCTENSISLILLEELS
jgi:hypothetical protein